MTYSAAQIGDEYRSLSSKMTVALLDRNKSPKSLSHVNSLQTELSDIADSTFPFPQLFTEQRIGEIYDLLERASKYLMGSEYEKRALERPDEFRQRVSIGIDAATSMQRLDRAA